MELLTDEKIKAFQGALTIFLVDFFDPSEHPKWYSENFPAIVQEFEKAFPVAMATAKEEIRRRLEVNDAKSNKEYLIEIFQNKFKEDLEKKEWFVRWTGKVNVHGHQVYEEKCGRCNDGKYEFCGELKNCIFCRGTGKVEGPHYCRECNRLNWFHDGPCRH